MQPRYKEMVGGFSRLQAPRFADLPEDTRQPYDVLRGEVRLWKGSRRQPTQRTAPSGSSTPSTPSTPRVAASPASTHTSSSATQTQQQ